MEKSGLRQGVKKYKDPGAISRQDRGVNEYECNLWCKLEESPDIIPEFVKRNPEFALKFFYNFINRDFANSLTKEANQNCAIKVGSAFLVANRGEAKYNEHKVLLNKLIEDPGSFPNEKLEELARSFPSHTQDSLEYTFPQKEEPDPTKNNPDEPKLETSVVDYNLGDVEKRLSEILKERRVETLNFFEKIGINYSSFRSSFSKSGYSLLEKLEGICSKGDISIDYLVFGLGPKSLTSIMKQDSKDYEQGYSIENLRARTNSILKDRKMNVSKASKLLGIPYIGLYNFLKGKSPNISVENTIKLCKGLNMGLNELLYDIKLPGINFSEIGKRELPVTKEALKQIGQEEKDNPPTEPIPPEDKTHPPMQQGYPKENIRDNGYDYNGLASRSVDAMIISKVDLGKFKETFGKSPFEFFLDLTSKQKELTVRELDLLSKITGKNPDYLMYGTKKD